MDTKQVIILSKSLAFPGSKGMGHLRVIKENADFSKCIL